MLSAGTWKQNQPNSILFVLINSAGSEVVGLGSTFTLQISKAGGVFAGSAGVKTEVGLGWYRYVSTMGEADTPGPVAVVVTHASTLQQNLEYVTETRVETAILFTYTVRSTSAGNPPIAGVDVFVYTDSGAANFVWAGKTDTFGVARDANGDLPRFEPGVYYFFSFKNGYVFSNPDIETVS